MKKGPFQPEGYAVYPLCNVLETKCGRLSTVSHPFRAS